MTVRLPTWKQAFRAEELSTGITWNEMQRQEQRLGHHAACGLGFPLPQQKHAAKSGRVRELYQGAFVRFMLGNMNNMFYFVLLAQCFVFNLDVEPGKGTPRNVSNWGIETFSAPSSPEKIRPHAFRSFTFDPRVSVKYCES